ncbi:MAG: YlxR family protein [Anaerolineae bacterium]|nr:YlxR family protein [Anaerolineae bacterium]
MTNKPIRHKHIPQRTCVVCRETDAKRSLTRLVRTADEGVQIDPTGKRNGRGAYLCDQPACWDRAVQSDVLEKALRTTLTVEDRQRIDEARRQKVDAGNHGR